MTHPPPGKYLSIAANQRVKREDEKAASPDPLPSDEAKEAAYDVADAQFPSIAPGLWPAVEHALTAAYAIDMPRREAEVRAARTVEVERLRAGLADVRATCIAGANAIEPRNVLGRVIGIVDAALDGNWRI